MARPTDIAVTRGKDGIYDATINKATRDLDMTEGLDSASLISLFSDRRARADEVADPMKRRGWIGDLVSDVPDDRHGSGIWLYEQRRDLGKDVGGIRMEAEASHRWMVDDGLARSVSASITQDPAARAVNVTVEITSTTGGKTSKAYTLASATKTGLLSGN